LREGEKGEVILNRALRKMFGPKRNEEWGLKEIA
jgi:hypothetical protein